MKITVFNSSPKGNTSITLQVIKYLEKVYKQDNFQIYNVGNGIVTEELEKAIQDCDLIIEASSIFHFSVHAQMMGFFEQLKNKGLLQNKKVTYILTSMKLGDEIAIGYVEQVVKSSGGSMLLPISLLDEDILNTVGQATVCHWYNYIRDCVENSIIKITSDVTVSIVDVGEYDTSIVRIIQQLEKQYTHYGVKVKKIDLRDYVIKPCTACYFCYSGRNCCIQDAHKTSCEDIYTNSNLILFVGKIKYGMYSQIYKTWLDRHVQWGRTPLDAGYFVGNIVETSNIVDYNDIAYFKEHSKMYTQFSGDCELGVLELNVKETDESIVNKEVGKYVENSLRMFINDMYPLKTGIGTRVYKSFNDLVYYLQKLAPYDYEYFKAHGGYAPLKVNIHLSEIENVEQAKTTKENRLIPYNMMLESVNEPRTIPVKRDVSFEKMKRPTKHYQVEQKKKNFFKFRKG